MRQGALLAGLVLCTASGLRAQDSVGAEGFDADFRYLVTALEQTHPDPYGAFGGKVAFHRAAELARGRITPSMTRPEFRALVEEFLAALRDGHTGLGAEGVAVAGPRRPLPLAFGVALDGVFVSATTEEYRPLVGARVLAVESWPVDSLLEAVGRLTPSENRFGAYWNLGRMLRYDATAHRLFGEDGDALAFTLLTPAGDTIREDVAFQDAVSIVPRASGIELPAGDGLLDWTMIGPNHDVAYFVWNSVVSREVAEANRLAGNAEAVKANINWIFQYLDGAPSGDVDADLAKVPSLYEEFRAMLEEMKARDSRYLIVDLRRNSGGMTPLVPPLLYMLYGDAFLAHQFRAEYNTLMSPLFLAKFGIPSIDRYNASNGTDLRLGDYRFSYFWPHDTTASVEDRRAIDNVTYSRRLGAEQVADLDGEPVWTPTIVVLTSPNTFSAAYHFMYVLYDMGGTTVVGVPPRQAGNAFMEVTPFELPNTGMKGSISNAVQIFFPEDPERGKAFVPDFPMSWRNFAAYDFDPDAEVRYALDLIASGRIGSR